MSSRVLDFEKYTAKARQAVAEGQVLLLNQNHVLPLPKGSHVAVFGRMQLHYYKSGTGSGGMVNVNKVTGILEALEESEDVQVYEPLVGVYREWEKDHPFDEGVGWGNEPWSQEEMELTEALVEEAAEKNEYALERSMSLLARCVRPADFRIRLRHRCPIIRPILILEVWNRTFMWRIFMWDTGILNR